MAKLFEFAEKLGVTVLTHVSVHGGGLYLYIPRDLVEAYKIHAGDKVEVQLLRLYKPAPGNATLSEKRSIPTKSVEEGGE